MTKYEIAKRLGVSHQAVYKWFSGDSLPTIEHIVKLSNILGQTMEETIAMFPAKKSREYK